MLCFFLQNYETTESRIKREFEAYGPIKRVGTLEHPQVGLRLLTFDFGKRFSYLCLYFWWFLSPKSFLSALKLLETCDFDPFN